MDRRDGSVRFFFGGGREGGCGRCRWRLRGMGLESGGQKGWWRSLRMGNGMGRGGIDRRTNGRASERTNDDGSRGGVSC